MPKRFIPGLDPVSARSNLNVYSKPEVDQLVGVTADGGTAEGNFTAPNIDGGNASITDYDDAIDGGSAA